MSTIRRWFERLIKKFQCEHDYETLGVYGKYVYWDKSDPYEVEWIYRCRKCCKKKVITT